MNLQGRTLGQRLYELRMIKQLRQEDLCKRLGIGATNYSKYENDQVVRPNPEIVKKLADFYEVPVQDLMKKFEPFDHLPAHIKAMVEKEDSLPFLVEAYKKYKEYVNEKNTK